MRALQEIPTTENPPPDGYSPTMTQLFHGHRRSRALLPGQQWNQNLWLGPSQQLKVYGSYALGRTFSRIFYLFQSSLITSPSLHSPPTGLTTTGRNISTPIIIIRGIRLRLEISSYIMFPVNSIPPISSPNPSCQGNTPTFWICSEFGGFEGACHHSYILIPAKPSPVATSFPFPFSFAYGSS